MRGCVVVSPDCNASGGVRLALRVGREPVAVGKRPRAELRGRKCTDQVYLDDS